MRLIIAAAVLAVAVGCTGGGGGDPAQAGQKTAAPKPETTQAPKVHVKEVGYGLDADMFGRLAAVAVVDNPSTARVQVLVDIAAYDRAGKVLGQESTYVAIGSQQTGAVSVGVEVGEDAVVDKVAAEVDIVDHAVDDTPGRSVTAKSVAHWGDDYSDGRVTAQLTNGYDANLRHYEVTAVCYRDGGIVGGGFTYVDVLHRAGTDRPVEVPVDITGDADPERCDLYASLDWLTSNE